MKFTDLSDFGRDDTDLFNEDRPISLIDTDILESFPSSIRTSIAHDRDYAIIKKLMNTRKNNKKARAFAEVEA